MDLITFSPQCYEKSSDPTGRYESNPSESDQVERIFGIGVRHLIATEEWIHSVLSQDTRTSSGDEAKPLIYLKGPVLKLIMRACAV